MAVYFYDTISTSYYLAIMKMVKYSKVYEYGLWKLKGYNIINFSLIILNKYQYIKPKMLENSDNILQI